MLCSHSTAIRSDLAGETLQRRRVDDAEDGGVRADADGERGDGDEREAGRTQQQPRAVTKSWTMLVTSFAPECGQGIDACRAAYGSHVAKTAAAAARRGHDERRRIGRPGPRKRNPLMARERMAAPRSRSRRRPPSASPGRRSASAGRAASRRAGGRPSRACAGGQHSSSRVCPAAARISESRAKPPSR